MLTFIKNSLISAGRRYAPGLLISVLLAGGAQAQAPAWRWATAASNLTYAGTVADAAGNLYVTGSFFGTTVLGDTTLTNTSGDQVFVAKLTSEGAFQWVTQVTGSGGASSAGLAVSAAGDVYIAGSFTAPSLTFGTTVITNTNSTGFLADVFVARLSPAGAWQQAASGGGAGADDQVTGIALDASQRAYVTGRFRGPGTSFGAHALPFRVPAVSNHTPVNTFVARLNPTGQWDWATSVTGAISFGTGIAVTGSGQAYVVGGYQEGIAAFGTMTLPALLPLTAPNDNVFVAKLTPAGTWDWVQTVRSDNFVSAHAVAVDANDNAVITGQCGFMGGSHATHFGNDSLLPHSTGDVYVAKVSPGGEWLWAALASGTGNTYANGNALAVDASGDLYVSGDFSSLTMSFGAATVTNFDQTGAGSPGDLYVAKLNAAGTWQWAVAAGGLNNEEGRGIAVDGSGTVYVAGRSDLNSNGQFTNFGSIYVQNPGTGSYAFVARLSATGVGLSAESARDGLGCFPNPAHHTVRLTGTTAPTATLFDALGRAVRTWPLAAPTQDLDLTGLSAGLYTVQAGARARRLVVE